jgi:AraC-like DNA-binding protein
MRATVETRRLWARALSRKAADPSDDAETLLDPTSLVFVADADGRIHVARLRAEAEHRALLERICGYIEKNLGSETLTATSLQSAFKVSRSMLGRLFKDAGGVASHIRTRRLTLAAHRLVEDPDINITELLYTLGFTSPRQFQRAFRNHFGMSPAQWRERALMPDA